MKKYLFFIVFCCFVPVSPLFAEPLPDNKKEAPLSDDERNKLKRYMIRSSPRYIDTGLGTVNDAETNLIWLKDANCFGKKSLVDAIAITKTLSNGKCGLRDNSKPGDWRLPNYIEMKSLQNDYLVYQSTPEFKFKNIQTSHYWVTNPISGGTGYLWYVYTADNNMNYNWQETDYLVWPVRGTLKAENPGVITKPEPGKNL